MEEEAAGSVATPMEWDETKLVGAARKDARQEAASIRLHPSAACPRCT